MKYYNNIFELIGNTPLIKLNKITKGVKPLILAKLEYFNPGGSIKDRISWTMLEEAERKGLLKKGCTIVEPTSGNTGIGLAMAASVKGYKSVIVMPDKTSFEKINLLKSFGAEVVITHSNVTKDSPQSAHEVALRLSKEIPQAYLPNQFENQINPETHYKITGPEIWEQTEGKIDILVSGIGTGGTITGIARFLKEKNVKIKIIGVDPVGSIYSNNNLAPYQIEGIGSDFFPSVLDLNLIDEIISVSDKDAFNTARNLAKEEGILAGGSSGAALFAALKTAQNLSKEKVIIVLFPDSGRNYLSKLFSEEYLKENNLL
ncbi:MAG: cysteine synthase A [Armatimonadetes bacterium]|nr:cysteine synthase A [Armatimonadota bacterium]